MDELDSAERRQRLALLQLVNLLSELTPLPVNGWWRPFPIPCLIEIGDARGIQGDARGIQVPHHLPEDPERRRELADAILRVHGERDAG